MRRARALLLVCGLTLAAATTLAQDTGYEFMPPGGRTLLLGLLARDGGAPLADVAARSESAEAWLEWAAAQDSEMKETALSTFAGYAALNFPLNDVLLKTIAETGDAVLLPADGKDLAIAQCQFCHALFSGYLMHDRDEVGWKGTFKAPFHAEIPMTEVERDTFAHYSALNMPLRFEDVPPELRF